MLPTGILKKHSLHKPGSVIPVFTPKRRHLSAINIAVHLYLPTLIHRAGRPQTNLYVAFQHPRFTHAAPFGTASYALTARFHPYPTCAGRLFSVALSSSASRQKPRRYRGGLPCAARTFLPPCGRRQPS